MKRIDAFKSDYFKSSHLIGQPLDAIINECVMGKIVGSDDEKPILSFKDQKMSMILNGVNWDAIEELYGDDTDGWGGKKITLFQSTCKFQGKKVDCIRVRPPAAAADPVDEIPF